MTATQRRLAAAVELVAASDGLRVAARAGVATRAHQRRLRQAEQAWDTTRSGGEIR